MLIYYKILSLALGILQESFSGLSMVFVLYSIVDRGTYDLNVCEMCKYIFFFMLLLLLV